MLLQTNSYVVPRDRKAEHARLVRRFRQTFTRLGCDNFEVYEQVGSNWSAGESSGRFVQIMRFRDRRHQLAVQEAERNDPDAQTLIAEFCELINFPYQRQQGLFAVGFYIGVLPSAARRQPELADKTAGSEDELDEESAEAGSHPATPAQPAALVEPGAATHGPIIPPVAPGQVPIITPAPGLGEERSTESKPTASEVTSEEPDGGSQGILDEGHDADDTFSALDLGEEPMGGKVSGESPAPAGRWQTSDEIANELEISPAELSDVDENGQVRVADEALLQAEAEFAAFVGEPADAFDEMKEKPPVLQGTLLDDVYGGDAVPMNEDDALEALETPASPGEHIAPTSNGQTEQDLIEEDIEHFKPGESEGEIDGVELLPEPPTANPPQPNKARR